MSRPATASLASLLSILPAHARKWLETSLKGGRSLDQLDADELAEQIEEDEAFDAVGLRYVESTAPVGDRSNVLNALYDERPERHAVFLAQYASQPEIAANASVLWSLCELDPAAATTVLPAILIGAFYQKHAYTWPSEYGKGYQVAARRLGQGGDAVFEAVAAHGDSGARLCALDRLLETADTSEDASVEALARKIVAAEASASKREPLYALMLKYRAALFLPVWTELFFSPLKTLRTHAIEGLMATDVELAALLGEQAMASKQAELRQGAVALFLRLGNGTGTKSLKKAWVNEKSGVVRADIRRALQALGVEIEAETLEEAPTSLTELNNKLAGQKRVAKAPGGGWLDVAGLPTLHGTDGERIGEAVIVRLLVVQAAHKAIEAAPGSGGVLRLIDHARSGDFALALLNAWLASPQEAKDRWALAIAGALGDTRILSVLNSWIPKWCEASRGKLAEYAAQAIALQGSDEALMLLDALATRYRSKQRNIGAAAAQAFQAAAEARGLSPDELGDVVVPAFGFDADGVRDFSWDGGAARAELGMELKLSWSDPESDKALKGLPASAPDALKAEVKELNKLLREAAKGQAARLELALVRQRRWPVARWRELYETHPVLRAYATRLVWGVYGKTATGDAVLLRCFRRYPNGLLADAAGGLEELPEADALIGMVHPLELSAETVAAWRAHLTRFKVSPPFAQLDRPVERLDALHANRRELAVAKDRALGAGTFRSRAERRGWVRGSVIDAGMVAGYYKAFPGAGVEVSLEMEGMYVGIDPMETITLGVARFARADSVKRGSYVYDDPQAGDARVLPFGEVPPVVYSEIVGDLKAIAGIVEQAADAENGDA